MAFDIVLKRHHIFQAVCLGRCDRNDTWSQSVKAWKKWQTTSFQFTYALKGFVNGDKFSVLSSTEINPQFFNTIFYFSYTDKASTSTSVSTVQITIFLWPCLAISFTCKNTLVFASSWLYGLTLDRSKPPLLLMQMSSYAHTSVSFSLPSDITVLDKKNNNSVLFWSKRRKRFQFVGATEFSCTFLGKPFPLFTRVAVFKFCFL